jgi:hypothetical protein
MGALTDARTELAAVVSAAGIDTTPYPPDSLTPPAAFVDSVSLDLQGGGSFCTGLATANLITVAQRNDKAGATQYLEDLITPILENLGGLAGLRVTGVDSGTTNIGGADLPAVVYTVEFFVSS